MNVYVCSCVCVFCQHFGNMTSHVIDNPLLKLFISHIQKPLLMTITTHEYNTVICVHNKCPQLPRTIMAFERVCQLVLLICM